MSITRKLTIRTLKKNPKRTLVTIVGIILATALITAVANLAESFRASMIVYEREIGGDYHVCFNGVSQENRKYFENNMNFRKMSVVGEVGYALFEDSKNPNKPYLYILSMDESGRDMTSMRLNSGRWPENESEIVISSHMRSNGGSRLVVGDSITLTLGKRDIGAEEKAYQNCAYLDGEESFLPVGQKEYTVVGIMQRPGYNVEPYIAPGYTAVTFVSDLPETATIYASYTSKGLKNRWEVAEALSAYAYDRFDNAALLRWETGSFSGTTMRMVYGMGVIALVIIIVTGVFCIRNSFQISLTEKLRMYGMLSSVGTTSKQRKKMVYCEAFYLGIVGIPLGIGSGVLATFVLIKVCGEMFRYAVEMTLYFKFSLLAMIAGAILSVVTILLSAVQSARKASKISPISAIRSNETVRRGKREMRVPRFIKGIFGIGGTLAYKNLRRSKVKYRTTVVSIVVSVAVFISMTTFVRLGFRVSDRQDKAGKYPIVITMEDEEREEEAALICSWEDVKNPIILRQTNPVVAPADQLRITKECRTIGEAGWNLDLMSRERDGYFRLYLYALGESAYEEYCHKVGIASAEAAKGAILYAEYCVALSEGNGFKYFEGTIADFQRGDVLDLSLPNSDSDRIIPLPVVCQTKVQPDFMRSRDNGRVMCIVSDAWMDKNMADWMYPHLNLYIQCEDADVMETHIRNDALMYNYYVSNYERAVKEERNFWLLMAIFLYGFITVISLIGVTNIFNTVTTNMELRSREFSMLRSIGMTGREFRRMIQLESLFYGGGSLCIGVPLGCVLSRLFYLVFGEGIEVSYEWPLSGIGISVVAVFLLLLVIMHYSMGKIKKKNIIDTIQNENI